MVKFSKDDFLNLDVFERLNAEFSRLAAVRGVGVPLLNLSAGIATLPLPAFINTIERNLDALARATPTATIPPTKTWLGEDRDGAWLNFEDVNRWFESLVIIGGA